MPLFSGDKARLRHFSVLKVVVYKHRILIFNRSVCIDFDIPINHYSGIFICQLGLMGEVGISNGFLTLNELKLSLKAKSRCKIIIIVYCPLTYLEALIQKKCRQMLECIAPKTTNEYISTFIQRTFFSQKIQGNLIGVLGLPK